MSSFTRFDTSLMLEFIPTKGDLEGKLPQYDTLKAFTYYVGSLDSGVSVTVPERFRTDIASVPWGFRWLVPPMGRYGQACVLHDYLCDYGILTTKESETTTVKRVVSRKEADDIFLEAMEVLEVSTWRRYLMYYAVRTYAILSGKDRNRATAVETTILKQPETTNAND